MSMKNEIQDLLNNNLSEPEVQVVDVMGNGRYFFLHIKASEFKDKTKLDQHKIVNSILQDLLQEKIHAIELKTEEKVA